MPSRKNPGFDVAVVQDASVVLDRDRSVQRTIELAREAAANGAKLVLFPEAFIPGYPRGLSFGAIVGSRSADGRALFRRYAENAVDIPGPEFDLLEDTASELGIYLAVGLIERDPDIPGTLYCSLLLWNPEGILLNHHRKLKPTASERLIWGEGQGAGLHTVPTEAGRVGGLICWENLMPLARAALYKQGVEIYLAPTADSRETWQATIQHIALEGRCYVLSANQFVTKADYPDDLDRASARELADAPDPLSRGGSAIVGPMGEYVAGPLWDEAGILYAHIDPGAVTEARFDFDAVGHYSRPDIFTLLVHPKPDLDPWSDEDPLGGLVFGGDDSFLGALAANPDLFFEPPPIFGPGPDEPGLPMAWKEKKPDWAPAKPAKRRRRK